MVISPDHSGVAFGESFRAMLPTTRVLHWLLAGLDGLLPVACCARVSFITAVKSSYECIRLSLKYLPSDFTFCRNFQRNTPVYIMSQTFQWILSGTLYQRMYRKDPAKVCYIPPDFKWRRGTTMQARLTYILSAGVIVFKNTYCWQTNPPSHPTLEY